MEYVDALPSDEESCYYTERLELTHDPSLPPAFTDDELAQILPHCPNIVFASLSGVPDLSSRTLILLATHAPRLAAVDVSGCAELTDLGLRALAIHATSLAAIALSRVPGTTDRAVGALARGLPRLRELEMDALPLITARATRDVWTYARGLRRWTLAGCMHLTDAGFPWVAPADDNDVHGYEPEPEPERADDLPPLVLPPTHTLSALRELDLSHCFRLTDAAVRGLVAHAPRLHRLGLAGCGALTDHALHALCALGAHLAALDLGGLARVSDAGVCALAGACGGLRSVDISYATNLTDLSILVLGSLPRLQRLAASGLPKVTDGALLFLAEHALELEELHLSFCEQLTLHGVRAVLRRLSKLQQLSLSGIPVMRRRGLRRFSELPLEGHDEHTQGVHRVFEGANIRGLHEFLEKEQWRKRECERLNILYSPRGDDSTALY